MRGHKLHDNPNVQEFTKNTQALREITYFAKAHLEATAEGTGAHPHTLQTNRTFMNPSPKEGAHEQSDFMHAFN